MAHKTNDVSGGHFMNAEINALKRNNADNNVGVDAAGKAVSGLATAKRAGAAFIDASNRASDKLSDAKQARTKKLVTKTAAAKAQNEIAQNAGVNRSGLRTKSALAKDLETKATPIKTQSKLAKKFEVSSKTRKRVASADIKSSNGSSAYGRKLSFQRHAAAGGLNTEDGQLRKGRDSSYAKKLGFDKEGGPGRKLSVQNAQNKKLSVQDAKGRKFKNIKFVGRAGDALSQNSDGNVGMEGAAYALKKGQGVVNTAINIGNKSAQIPTKIAKRQQKRAIKKAYAKAKSDYKAVKNTAKTFTTTANRVKEFFSGSATVVKKIVFNPWVLAIVGGLLLVVVIGSTPLMSCTGGAGAVIATSFTADDADILAVEADYAALEADLLDWAMNYETEYPDYDEYVVSFDEIGHNPYQLAALLTVIYDNYTQAEVQAELSYIFGLQYTKTVVEDSYTVTTTETYEVEVEDCEVGEDEKVYLPDDCLSEEEEELELDPQDATEVDLGTLAITADSNSSTGYYLNGTAKRTYEFETEVGVLYVTLTNIGIDAVVNNYVLCDDELEWYNSIVEAYGNRPDLFDDIYSVSTGSYLEYDVSYSYTHKANGELNKLGKMLEEAEKYLGYPYVWGGSSPSTSFDCSGFVSHVINNCGNGWSVGRLTANGLLGICTIVSEDEAQPGDLVFFEGTYSTSGASHVGVYVGDGMMIHCGNPISYASIETDYWQEHLLCFGSFY